MAGRHHCPPPRLCAWAGRVSMGMAPESDPSPLAVSPAGAIWRRKFLLSPAPPSDGELAGAAVDETNAGTHMLQSGTPAAGN
jgi:hypothetical protein